MKKLLFLITILAASYSMGASPVTPEQSTRFSRIFSMSGTYTLVESKKKPSPGCLEEIDVFANTITMNGKEFQVLWVGPYTSFPIANVTKSFPAGKGCVDVQVSSFSDDGGWVEQRTTEICNPKARTASYKRAAFNFDEGTLRLMTKRNGKTEDACEWRKD